MIGGLLHTVSANYSAPVGVRSIVINMSVCLSVCMSVYVSVCLRAYLWKLIDPRKILCADPLWPWLSPPLTALCYVRYFGFYG